MNWLLVLAGGMVGAPLRHLADTAARSRFGDAFPWGILAVNVAGSALLGALTGVGADLQLLLGTGLCGALTTYSTFSYETLRLPLLPAVANAAVSVAAGFGAAYAAYGLF
ncbi:fluoride efflux transporter FluC [Streptomyces sp. NPDC060194]|uniref:fluoride efflux transporter FluC n=1 Tax=Streptomyces sp. NPDC060194 TaxID=3347069 RepID=UPI00365CF6B0